MYTRDWGGHNGTMLADLVMQFRRTWKPPAGLSRQILEARYILALAQFLDAQGVKAPE